MRILILRGGALGDFIVTWPALRALRLRWREAEIEWVGNRRAAELALRSGDLDRAHSQDDARFAPLFSEAPLPETLAAWIARFDLILNFWSDPEDTVHRHLSVVGPEVISRGASVATEPAAKHFLAAITPVDATMDPGEFRFVPDEKSIAEAERRLGGLRDFIAVHPGSGSRKKNWPREQWTELLQRLPKPILAITGEAESEPWEGLDDEKILRAHDWPLPTLAAALAQCRFFIGHDSGISHLAAAVGAKCALLFGPTDPKIWAPPGKNIRVIQKSSDLASITVEDVITSL